MQKRISLLTLAAGMLVLAGAGGEARAQYRIDGADGCAVLANLVYSEVVASVLFESYRLPPTPEQVAALSCDRTAASVSSGFSRALAAMNVSVSWAMPSVEFEGVCGSRDLALCYPVTKAVMWRGVFRRPDADRIWQAVAGAVSGSMPTGTISDFSSFRESELRVRLSRELSGTSR